MQLPKLARILQEQARAQCAKAAAAVSCCHQVAQWDPACRLVSSMGLDSRHSIRDVHRSDSSCLSMEHAGLMQSLLSRRFCNNLPCEQHLSDRAPFPCAESVHSNPSRCLHNVQPESTSPAYSPTQELSSHSVDAIPTVDDKTDAGSDRRASWSRSDRLLSCRFRRRSDRQSA